MTTPTENANTWRERAEGIAQRFHETYERLAPTFGYSTRERSRVPWPDVPEDNRRLMVAVVEEVVIPALEAQAEAAQFASGVPGAETIIVRETRWNELKAAESERDRLNASLAADRDSWASTVLERDRLAARVAELKAALRKWETIFPAHRAECLFRTRSGCTCGLDEAHALTRAALALTDRKKQTP